MRPKYFTAKGILVLVNEERSVFGHRLVIRSTVPPNVETGVLSFTLDSIKYRKGMIL